MVAELKQTDVVILCGGLGTRLRPVVSDSPKVLAKIGEKTFLDILINNLLLYGFENIILSVGYMKKQIKNHFNYAKEYNIRFCEEEEPLGTGGALKKAKLLINSETFMVMNGDSFCQLNFRDFYDFHLNKKALLSMVLVRIKSGQDYGTVLLNDSKRITNFKEKVPNSNESLINAGIYLMQKDIFSYMPEQNHFSLEYDLFPKIINNRCYGFLTEGKFIDIGTPDRYEEAINVLG